MNTEYATSDFWLACYLRAAGYRMTDTRRDGSRLQFMFENTPDLRAAVQDFFSGAALVSPQAMASECRQMKSLIHNAP